jgi:hypothetical protein
MTTVAAAADPLSPFAIGAHARELLERDRWSSARLLRLQRERLRALVRHAVDRSRTTARRSGAARRTRSSPSSPRCRSG